MRSYVLALSLVGGLFISCDKPSKELTPQELVSSFYKDVIFGKDVKSCTTLVENYLVFNTLYFYKLRPTKEQSKAMCEEYVKIAKERNLFPTYGIKDIQVSIGNSQDEVSIASVFVIYQDGRSEHIGNVRLHKRDNRWYMEY